MNIQEDLERMKDLVSSYLKKIEELQMKEKVDFQEICNLYGYAEGIAGDQRALERKAERHYA